MQLILSNEDINNPATRHPPEGFANASLLTMPAFVTAANSSEQLHLLEIIGLLVRLGALAIESLLAKQNGATC